MILRPTRPDGEPSLPYILCESSRLKIIIEERMYEIENLPPHQQNEIVHSLSNKIDKLRTALAYHARNPDLNETFFLQPIVLEIKSNLSFITHFINSTLINLSK